MLLPKRWGKERSEAPDAHRKAAWTTPLTGRLGSSRRDFPRNSSSSSSSRPNSGVSLLSCCASKRRSTPLILSTCQAAIGSAQPLSATAPRSRYSKCPPVSRRVLAEITTASGENYSGIHTRLALAGGQRGSAYHRLPLAPVTHPRR